MSQSILKQRLQLFPISTSVDYQSSKTRLTIAGCDLQQLAQEFGTPLYLYDQATLEDSLQLYQQALNQFYPGESGVTYAAKAYLCTAIAQWVKHKNLLLDCTGQNELAIAHHAGLQTQDCLIHGVNKSEQDIKAAFEQARIIVVDNPVELERIIQIANASTRKIPEIWLRLRPGLPVDTHQHTQTGQADSKFGMSPGEILAAVAFCQDKNLPLTGLHFHQGSQFNNPTPIAHAIDITLDLAVTLREKYQWELRVISPGGGWGVSYHEDDLPHPSIDSYVKFICHQILQGCHRRNLPLPGIQLEPGRSLVARAGVALYRVGAVKHSGDKHWLLIDGGLADNPRPALYGARYSALPVTQPDRPITTQSWIAGPYCESGDILINNLPMPKIQVGELIAVPVSGAYQLSMASNYNGACKPAVLWLQDGHASLIQEREETQTLFSRDHLLFN